MKNKKYTMNQIIEQEPYILKVKSRAFFFEEYCIIYDDTVIEKFWGGIKYYKETKEKVRLPNVAFREGMLRVAITNDLI